MARLRALVASPFVLPLLLTACSGVPETLVDSDVPQIVGLENRHSSAIEHSGDELVGGHFLYRGTMKDPVTVAEETTNRYKSYGWTLRERRISTTCATLIFDKDSREVEVDLKANTLNPAMGSGVIDVRRRAPSVGASSSER